MTQTLPLLNDEEVRRCRPADEESGFGALATARGHLPLAAMDVRAQIDGLLSHVSLRQTFVNTLGEPLEATYIFPLPDRAAVTRFRMEVAGRVIDGVLKERGEARRDYEQAVRTGHRAAIAEEERPDVFTLRVGNLMPGESAVVELGLVGPLPYADGEATFHFPLVVAPRYVPGAPLPGRSVGDGTHPDTDAVPDASRVTPPVLLPGHPNPVRLSIAVDLDPGTLPLGPVRSSLHAVVEESANGRGRRVALRPGERLDRDFVLRFRLGDQAVRTFLALQPDADGREGTFALTVVPPVGQPQAQRPRDVVFVLDRSGSMDGWKMVAARRALARMVDTLTDRDRFTVYAFDNSVETPPGFGPSGLVPATDRNRFRAVEFLAKVQSRGGTEMAEPLDRAVNELTAGDGDVAARDRVLVLVTDGQVGNEDQVLRTLGPRVQGVRVFALGIDQAVNAGFLHRLTALGGGACELVESEDRLDEAMDRVHRHLGTPVLTGLRLQALGLELDHDTVVLGRLPDLFHGAPLCIQGRYRGAAEGSVVLQGADAAGRSWSEAVRGVRSDNPAVGSVWARGHLRDLEDRYVLGRGEWSQLERRIVETSLRYGVLCRFTAYVAVDRSEVVNAGGQVRKLTQPVEAPAGWDMLARDRRLEQQVACRGRGTFAFEAMPPAMTDDTDADLYRSMSLEGFLSAATPAASCAPSPAPGTRTACAAEPRSGVRRDETEASSVVSWGSAPLRARTKERGLLGLLRKLLALMARVLLLPVQMLLSLGKLVAQRLGLSSQETPSKEGPAAVPPPAASPPAGSGAPAAPDAGRRESFWK